MNTIALEQTGVAQRWPALAAYLAATLFVALFIAFGVAPASPFVGLLGVAVHLALFPVIAALPASPWARAAGYGWLVGDIALNVLALNVSGSSSVDVQLVATLMSALRNGIHISAALWVLSGSLNAKGLARVIGAPTALLFFGLYSLVAAWVPMWVFLPAFGLFPLWLVLVGRVLGSQARS